jgi:hypothetical protein
VTSCSLPLKSHRRLGATDEHSILEGEDLRGAGIRQDQHFLHLPALHAPEASRAVHFQFPATNPQAFSTFLHETGPVQVAETQSGGALVEVVALESHVVKADAIWALLWAVLAALSALQQA